MGFPALVTEVLESFLAADPVTATFLGDHRGDDRLPDPGSADDRLREVRAQLGRLADVQDGNPDQAVDRAVLTTALRSEELDLDVLAEDTWDPMRGNPGAGLRVLLSRDFAPLPERMEALAGRLRATPSFLAAGRERLGMMSRVHLDTALDQLGATVALLDDGLPPGGDAPGLADAVTAARAALVEHRAWLADRADNAQRSPRLGAELFARKLALTLDTDLEPEDLLRRAEADLERVGARITETAAALGGTVPEVLDQLARDAPDDAGVLDSCRAALTATTAFVRGSGLVTVHDDPVEVVEMPGIDRGVSVAYCRPPGPLETAALPTEFAVSPTPAGWTPAQVASFYREYNTHMLHDLTVHEAMPGHALQLMHSNRYRGATPVRAVWWSGTFVEGWAVYAEELMADAGYPGVHGAEPAALRMQQLKMQLRMTLNAVLDVRYHCDDLDEGEALRLMRERGVPGRRGGARQVAPGPTDLDPAVHLLRRVPGGPRVGRGPAPRPARCRRAGSARHGARLRLAPGPAPAHAARPRGGVSADPDRSPHGALAPVGPAGAQAGAGQLRLDD